MAENSVTIALKLDTSQFQSGLDSIKQQLKGVSKVNIGGTSSARQVKPTSELDEIKLKNAQMRQSLSIEKIRSQQELLNIRKAINLEKLRSTQELTRNRELRSSLTGIKEEHAFLRKAKFEQTFDPLADIDPMFAKQKEKKPSSEISKFDESVKGIIDASKYFTSMLRGNMSSFNIAGAGQGLMSAVGMGGAGAGAGTAGAGATVAGAGTAGAGATAAGAGATAGTGGLALLAVIPVLVAIGVGVAALVVIMEAIQFALKPILTMLSMIGKILGAALMPISLIIVELLKPLIWVMMPLVRIFMSLLMPIRKFLAARMIADKEEIQGLSQVVSSGNPLEKLQALSLIEDLMLENIMQTIGYAFSGVGSFIIDGLLDIILFVNNGILDAINTITTFVGQALIGLGTSIADMLPISDDDKLKLKNSITTTISDAIDLASTDIKKIKDNNTSFTESIKEFKNNIITQIQEELANDETPITEIAKNLSESSLPNNNLTFDWNETEQTPLNGLNETLAIMSEESENVNNAIMTMNDKLEVTPHKASKLELQLESLGKAIDKLVANMISAVASIISKANELASQIINAASKTVSDTVKGIGETLGFSKKTTVNDFILQPGGRLIETNPNDTIMGSKNGFGGSNAVNVSMNFNVYGNMDSAMSDKIMDLVKRTIQTEMRSISR